MRTFPLFLVVAFVACSRQPAEPAPTAASPSDVPAEAQPEPEAPPAAVPDESSAVSGAITEDQFKALHELTGEGAPDPRGEMLEVGGARAYLSLPAQTKAPMPAVLVIHEWWGLNDHIKHYADRLAAEGYAALAVDLYGGELATTPDRAMELVKSVNAKKAQATLTAAHQFLASDPRVQASGRGVIGWCFGGGWALQHALHADDLDAAVMYYGRVVTDVARLRDIKAPILGIFANKDESIPPDQVDAFDQALDRANVRHQIERYDAEHAFANPSSARYDQAAATKAWDKTKEFLAANLAK